MRSGIIQYLALAFLAILAGGCNSVGNTCLTGGCYGPFEITIKTQKGEFVEDVIVRLSHITAGGFEGLTHTYKETAIGNTNEKISFPRGFVYRTDASSLELNLSIIHPDYQSLAFHARFPNEQGVIDLGEKFMIFKQDAMDQSNAKLIVEWKKQGLSDEEIEKNLEGKRNFNVLHRLAKGSKYFPLAIAIGREDILHKYLPGMVREYIKHQQAAGKKLDKTYDELFQIYYESYREKARKL